MKKLLVAIFAVVTVACSTSNKLNKVDYSVIPDNRAKVLKGIINRSVLENDTSFAWFKENIKWGEVDADAVAAFKQKGREFKMIVFGGTWCEDTQNILPKFYRLVDKSGYSEKNITLVAVDRKKQTTHDLHTIYKITNVPTFIVLKDGKEIGRVVEYGKSGSPEKDLAEIVQSIQ